MFVCSDCYSSLASLFSALTSKLRAWTGMSMNKKVTSIFRHMKIKLYEPADSTPREQCPCCDYISLAERGNYLVCPICYWEDDGLDINSLDIESGANHNITLRHARQNFRAFGACEIRIKKWVLSVQERKNFEYDERVLEP